MSAGAATAAMVDARQEAAASPVTELRASEVCSGQRGRRVLDVALEDGRLGQPRQALPNGVGSRLADPLDREQVVDACRKKLLQVAEVVDKPVHHGRGQPRD